MKMAALRKSAQKASGPSPMIHGRSKPELTAVHPLLRLQQSIGNQAVGRLIQTKLQIRQPGDAHEQDADRVADHVRRMSEPRVQRKCAACEAGMTFCPKCEDKGSVAQRKADHDNHPNTMSHSPNNFVDNLGSGRALDRGTRDFFESRFGADFGDVRVHTNQRAADSARSVNARAYTVGRDVVFGKGQYAPESAGGRTLIAHELTHTIQQASPDLIQRKIGDGHDLASPRFAGDKDLEACFDDKKDSVKIGDRGNHVTKLQIALTDDAIEARAGNPLPRFGEDGIFGKETKTAVKAFQARMGLPEKEQDGIVGPTTMALLDKQFPPVAGSAHSQPTQLPVDKKTVTVNFTVLFGSTKSVSNALNVANVLYAPANLLIRAGKVVQMNRAQTEAVIGADHILKEHFFSAGTDEEKALFKVNQDPDAISIYFVERIEDEEHPGEIGDNGYTIAPPEENFGFSGIAVQNAASDKTFAHELGHMLRGFGHVSGDPNALMAPGGVGTQFSAAEIATMRNNPFAK